MKCSYHSDTDAMGVCVNCGRAVCRDCRLILGNKIYCQVCADEIFGTMPITVPVRDRSASLTTGGILSIVAGALGLVGSFVMFMFIASYYEEWMWQGSSFGWVLVFYLVPTLLCVPAVVGGILALRRKAFGFALAGAICGIFGGPFFGLGGMTLSMPSSLIAIAAVVLIAMARGEFKKVVSAPYTLSQPVSTSHIG